MVMTRRAFKDHYKVLGVPSDASPRMIKKAYRRLARANHPDHNPGDPGAAQRFREISEAYEVLADAAERGKYDAKIKNAFGTSLGDVADAFLGGGIFGGGGIFDGSGAPPFRMPRL